MTCRELRIELHKNHYCEAALGGIAANIANKLDCVNSFSVNSAASQIILVLNTTKPSEVNLSSATTQALIEFISSTGLQYEGELMNMYNILISHIEGDTSTVIIML